MFYVFFHLLIRVRLGQLAQSLLASLEGNLQYFWCFCFSLAIKIWGFSFESKPLFFFGISSNQWH